MKHRSMTILRAGMFLLSAALFAALVRLLWQTVPRAAVRYGILGLCLAIYAVVGLWAWYQRRQVSLFADDLCETLDALMSGRTVEGYQPYEDSLTAKVQGKLMQYFDIMNEGKRQSQRDKETIQGLVSDISHQVKTPIANLKMINNTLLENEVSPQKQKEFLTAQASQLDKLDFLMQAMIKTSRLETGVISLEEKQQPVYDTLAAALGGILLNAEKKQIDVRVECPEHLDARHDRKWTTEALFNILDNAVKYTPAGGQIRVAVEGWEMYVKIDIADTGIGISEQHQGTIFKRFYREEAVHDVDGIGIGLYLAREIVTLQGGYIRVASEAGKGSIFSVFLLRK